VVELKNQSENLVYHVEKGLSELGDKIADDQKKPVTDLIDQLKTAIAQDDLEAMKSRGAEIQELFAKVSQMASAAGEVPPPSGAHGEGGSEAPSSEPKQANAKVVDADFEVVDDKQ